MRDNEICKECRDKFASIGFEFYLHTTTWGKVEPCRFCGAEREDNRQMESCIPVKFATRIAKPATGHGFSLISKDDEIIRLLNEIASLLGRK